MTLSDTLVDGSFKGLPPLLPPTPLAALGSLGWTVLDDSLPSPVAVLRASALANNRAWMRAFCARSGTALAPHVKTTMSPALFAMQAEDGAWGLTVATVHQAMVARKAGHNRLLLANEVIGRAELAWLAAELRAHPECEIVTLVDSAAAVERLAAATATVGRAIPVLVEVGFPGGRAGCRDVASAVEIARRVAATPPLVLRGVEAFEGLIPGRDADEREARVDEFLHTLCAVATACNAEGLFGDGPPLVSAGGSIFFDQVASRLRGLSLARPLLPLLRSGCYLTGDHGLYAAGFARLLDRDPSLTALGALLPALEVWGQVLSRPEPTRAILGVGKRDVGTDAGPPVPLRRVRPGDREPSPLHGARVVEVNDQHLHLELPPEAALEVGDRVAFGITHPCTTFDRWSVVLLVDDDWHVIGGIRTFFG